MNVRQTLPLMLSLAVLVVAIITMATINQRRVMADSDVLQQRSENQHLQRVLVQLQTDQAATKLNSINAGMKAVRLSFIETLIKIRALPGVVDLQYSLGDSRDRSADPEYLRTALRLELRHAESLLVVMERLENAASVWPHLLRGCAMHRQQTPAGLVATCFYDVYVWDVLL